MAKRKRPGDYEVGYGKPPVHAQFKPGHSGNSKGRRKGIRNFQTDLRTELNALVTVTLDGQPRKVSRQLATVLVLIKKALNGDIRAGKLVFDLAQTLDKEQGMSPADEPLSADDDAIIEGFLARRAATPPEDPTPGSEADGSIPASDVCPTRVKRSQKRVRLKPTVPGDKTS